MTISNDSLKNAIITLYESDIPKGETFQEWNERHVQEADLHKWFRWKQELRTMDELRTEEFRYFVETQRFLYQIAIIQFETINSNIDHIVCHIDYELTIL